MNARNPLPLLLCCLLLTGTLAGCQLHKAEEDEKATSSESESSTEDLFREADGGGSGSVQDQGRELQDRAGEIRTMEGTEQEKIDAVMEFEKDREKLNEDAGVN
ncbi:MAG: hypothetical protein ACLGI9_07515 [Thermoanaerobaculia bacterium]